MVLIDRSWVAFDRGVVCSFTDALLRMNFRSLYIVTCCVLVTSCATFYEVNYEFNKNFEQGRLEEAESLLLENEKIEKQSKTRFLYYTNRGVVAHLLGKYEESNDWLERAYIFGEDHRKNYVDFVASYLLNPNVITYSGEDHEHLMLLYYKVLNYLKMSNYDLALVECRRLNNRLYALGDKYVSENKYQKDAFIHTLMGIVYDASGDYNNAFIAYRNALKIYDEDYGRLFELSAPEQLKKDILRTAYVAGFSEEFDQFRTRFQMDFEPQDSSGGDLVFFWHNGLSPVKSEWSINFAIVDGEGGYFFFQNDDLGLNFPFYYGQADEEDEGIQLSDIQAFRVAFPKYVERIPYFNYADLELDGRVYPLQKAEDLNSIAFKTLNERMLEELGKGLLRVALKKTIEMQVRKENETLGFLAGVFNIASEQADTRNWQTIPHSIHYARVPLKEGENKVEIYTEGLRSESTEEFTFVGTKGGTQFHTYQSLESNVAF